MATRRPQKPKRRVGEIAQSRGVQAIRRRVAPSSHELFAEVNEKLEPEILGAGRLFTPETIGVTVIGFSQLTPEAIHKGPTTKNVLKQNREGAASVEVMLGKLGVYGGRQKIKLAFELESQYLHDEHQTIMQMYRDQGYPLRPNMSGYTPHCSVALLDAGNIDFFKDERTLARLDRVAGVMGQTIGLEPANCNNSSSVL